jgi:transposase
VFRPGIHDIAPKSIEQQDIQTLLRIRLNNKENRVSNTNQIRGLLSEYVIIIPVGFAAFNKQIGGFLYNTTLLIIITFLFAKFSIY